MTSTSNKNDEAQRLIRLQTTVGLHEKHLTTPTQSCETDVSLTGSSQAFSGKYGSVAHLWRLNRIPGGNQDVHAPGIIPGARDGRRKFSVYKGKFDSDSAHLSRISRKFNDSMSQVVK
jgi:hypothetical protein